MGLVEEWNYDTTPDSFPDHDGYKSDGRSVLEKLPCPSTLRVGENELIKYGLSAAPSGTAKKIVKSRRSKGLLRFIFWVAL